MTEEELARSLFPQPEQTFAAPVSQEQVMPAAQFAVNPVQQATQAPVNYGMGYGGDDYGYYDESGEYFTGQPVQPYSVPMGAQLNPANDRFSTPYYSAYTNKGDFAAAVGVDPNQAVRLVDGAGNVIFEGVGQDAAKQVVDQANYLSSTGGKKAAWQIDVKTPDSTDWQRAGYESVDKKKQSTLGKLADIGLPLLANFLVPGSGFLTSALAGAAGSGLSSALQGRSAGDALKRAALTGVTSGLIGGTAAGQRLTSGLGNAVSGGGGGVGAIVGSAGADTLTDATVERIIVEAAKQGVQLTVPQALAMAGANAATLGAFGSSGGGPTDVEGIEVTATPQSQVNVVPPFAFDPSSVAPGIDPNTSPYLPDQPLVPNSEITPPYQFDPTTIAPLLSIPANLDTGPGPMTPDKPTTPSLTDIAKLLGGVAGGVAGGSGGSPGQAGPYARAPIFSANLPAPKGIYANLAPRNTSGIDYKNYGYGPERSFYANVPDRAAGEAFTVPVASTPTGPVNSAPPAANTPAISAPPAAVPNRTPVRDLFTVFQDETAPFTADQKADLNRFLIENIDQLDPNSGTYKTLKAAGYKRGGNVFAVNGPGTGRSDEIDAKLSDGEYVIDAETVALLGDGSSKAGAQKLDKFRVNVRKHKGANLSKGKFSVDAKAPEAYMSGGRK